MTLQQFIKASGRFIFKLLYRVEIKGLEHYENAGSRAVIVANHVSKLDVPLLVTFLPDEAYFTTTPAKADTWPAKLFSKLFSLMVIDPAQPMANRSLIQNLKKHGRAVFFPEGRITTTGNLMKLYDTPATIAHLAGASIIPMRIDGAQYSRFSKLGAMHRLRSLPKITLTFLPPITLEDAGAKHGSELRDYLTTKLHDVMTGMMFASSKIDRTILSATLDARHIHGGKYKIAEDIERKPLNYDRLITGMFVLGRKIDRLCANQKNIAVLLPNSNGFLATFLALHAYNRVPALLNYSTGGLNMAAACTAAQVSTILTSRKFITLGGFEDDLTILAKQARVIYLEDLRDGISLIDKLRGLIKAKFPHTALRSAETNPNNPAVILFTSGSEGLPKGVVLSHRNIQANFQQIAARIPLTAQDIVFNALPMFHAFGLTLGAIYPLQAGIKMFLYPSPLHYKIVPELCYDIDATIVLGTDTFLMGYARTAHPYDFYSARFIVAGAERVKQETRHIWMEKFGLRIIEGYGATECSPIISANTPTHHRSGSVGRIFDGMEWRIEPVEGIEHGGRLIIKGPNVMLGYLRADNPGIIEPPTNGWYDTGDIVDVDNQGFVTILGRAKRFSKIAGEMISLTAIENALTEIYPESDSSVVAVPDQKKGEKLVLFTTDDTLQRKQLASALKTAGLTDLMIPRVIMHIAEIPLLGSGKTDYMTLNRQALTQEQE